VAQQLAAPTNYPEINSVLQELLSGARGILGDHFVGMYLDGSLAIGDFEPDKSDLDFVVVTASEVSSDTFGALKTMHDRIASGASKWARELEGSYISQRALRHDRRPAAHPYIDRGSVLAIVQQESGYWPIHRHMLRDHGVVLAGPLPQTLIDPVQSRPFAASFENGGCPCWSMDLSCRTASIAAMQSSRCPGSSTPFVTGRS
jgi:hypothetical protein